MGKGLTCQKVAARHVALILGLPSRQVNEAKVGRFRHEAVESIEKKQSGGVVGAANREIKKGAGASPLSSTDPPKPEHSRGCVPATPGSQYFICDLRMQVGCQAMGPPGFPFIRL